MYTSPVHTVAILDYTGLSTAVNTLKDYNQPVVTHKNSYKLLRFTATPLHELLINMQIYVTSPPV